MSKILLSLAPLTGLTADELEKKLKAEDGQALPEDEAGAAVRELILEHSKARAQTKADQFHQKGFSEGASKAEQAIAEKLKALGIEAETPEKGLAHLAKKMELLEEQAKAGPAKLTPDELKELKTFKQLLGEEVTSRTKDLTALMEQAKAEAQAAKQALQATSHQEAVRAALAPVLKAENANMGTNSAAAWRGFFANFPAERIKVENGKATFLNEDGTVVEDAYGNPRTAQEMLFNEANPLWFLGVDAKPKPQTPGKGASLDPGKAPILFKSQSDFDAQLKAAQHDIKRYTELLRAADEQQAQHGPLK